MRSNRSRRFGFDARAFTLVELLVVIAIMALLASLLMPALARARRTTKRIQCLSNIRTIGQAMQLYVDDHEGFYPGSWLPGSDGGSPPRSYDFIGVAGSARLWSTPAVNRVLNPYVGIAKQATLRNFREHARIARCPFDKGRSNQQAYYTTAGSSYVFYDRQHHEIRDGKYVIWEGAWAIEGHKESEISMPSIKMIVADIVVQASGDLPGWHDPARPKSPTEVSMTFADGHAEFITRRTGANNYFNHNARKSDIERLATAASTAKSYY